MDLDRHKIAFASPSYGPIDSSAVRHQRAAIMHAANQGVKWVGDVSPERMTFSQARNAVVDQALRQDADWIMWVDSDIILPVDAISTLVFRANELGINFLTGIYFQRVAPHYPLIAQFDRAAESFQWLLKWPEGSLFRIDGCGFGCVLTSTLMLRSMEPPWFNYEKYSEDFDFCMKAKKKGYDLYVDSTVLCGHLADPAPITRQHFIDVNRERFALEEKHEAGNAGSREEDSGRSAPPSLCAAEVPLRPVAR